MFESSLLYNPFAQIMTDFDWGFGGDDEDFDEETGEFRVNK